MTDRILDRCYLEITNVCNLKCKFCPGHRRKARTMSYEEFDVLTDKLKGRVKYLYFHLMGEPVLNRELPRFISVAKGKGFIPVLTTNGTLLDSESPSALAVIGATPYKINISLHAFEGNDGSDPSAYIAKISSFALMAASKGTIVVLRLWNQGGYDSRNGAIMDLLAVHFPRPWTEHRKGFGLAGNLYLEFDSMFSWPGQTGLDYGDSLFCYALRNQIGVLADGSVVPCCLDYDGKMTLGNLFDSSLQEILSSLMAKSMYDGFSNHKAVQPMCRNCGYAAVTKRYHDK